MKALMKIPNDERPGQHKRNWAQYMGEHIDLENTTSPSFRYFLNKL